MKCPTCKKDFEAGVKAAYELGLLDRRGPTTKQLQAYSLVVVQGDKHKEAAKKMGISRSEVTRLIFRIKRIIK